MSREGIIKIKICVRKRKNEKIIKEWKRVIERKKRKEKREEEWQERYERDESSERKIKVQERMSQSWETKLSLFFQPCAIRQRGRHRCLVVIFFFPCTCPPF
jgi:hypothetical protein